MPFEKENVSEVTVNPVQTFIQNAVRDGFPSQVTLRFNGPVDWNLNGVWVRDLELKVTPPYASPDVDDLETSVKALWAYGLHPLEFIEPVPYENLAGNEPAVDVATELLKRLKTSVEQNPYLSLHQFHEDGVLVSAELMFKP